MIKFKLFLSVCILLTSSSLYANLDTLQIYKQAKSVPIWMYSHPQKIARKVSQGLPDDASKVLAISYWICKNIHYTYTGQENRVKTVKTSKKVLRVRKATSYEYARLFKEMCAAVSIHSEIVHGYVKEFDFYEGDTLYRAEHVWNVVQMNKEWFILDLTLAANNLEPKTTLMSNVMWALFKVPSSVKIKPTKAYYPQWLNVKPDVAIATHMPILPMYQLLEFPITIQTFTMEDSVLQEYIQRYPQKTRNYSQLDKFVNLSITDKNVITAQKTLEENPNAHLTGGLYFYSAVESFKERTYLEQKGRLFATLEELRPMLQYSNMADSLFALAVNDDARELKSIQVRSEEWKRILQEYNKIHQVEIQDLKKLYTTEIQNAKKLEKQKSVVEDFVKANIDVYKATDITEQSRPSSLRNEDMYEGMRLLAAADSIQKEYRKILNTYEAMLEMFSKSHADQALQNQRDGLALNEKNTQILRKYVEKKGNNMPMIYPSNKAIEKRIFTDCIIDLERNNKNTTDTLINFLTINQSQLIDILKQYNTYVGLYLKTLKSAKAKLYEDAGEDNLYEQTVNEYKEYLNNFNRDFQNAISTLPEIVELLESEVELLDECAKLFKTDNTLEVSRHQQYMEYRKKFKTIDVDYIKHFLQQNKEYRKLIQKALK